MEEVKQIKTYVDFTEEYLDNNEIKLVIKEGSKSVEALRKREKVTNIISTIITYILITFLALIMIFPFYWMIITSLKVTNEIQAQTQTFGAIMFMFSKFLILLHTWLILSLLLFSLPLEL